MAVFKFPTLKFREIAANESEVAFGMVVATATTRSAEAVEVISLLYSKRIISQITQRIQGAVNRIAPGSFMAATYQGRQRGSYP